MTNGKRFNSEQKGLTARGLCALLLMAAGSVGKVVVCL